MIRLFATSLFIVSFSLNAQPGWRGDAAGSYPKSKAPTTWAKDQKIAWKTPLARWPMASMGAT